MEERAPARVDERTNEMNMHEKDESTFPYLFKSDRATTTARRPTLEDACKNKHCTYPLAGQRYPVPHRS